MNKTDAQYAHKQFGVKKSSYKSNKSSKYEDVLTLFSTRTALRWLHRGAWHGFTHRGKHPLHVFNLLAGYPTWDIVIRSKRELRPRLELI